MAPLSDRVLARNKFTDRRAIAAGFIGRARSSICGCCYIKVDPTGPFSIYLGNNDVRAAKAVDTVLKHGSEQVNKTSSSSKLERERERERERDR